MQHFSEDDLRDAYGRMDMENHPWARHASKEIESLESICCSFDGRKVIDAGCGRGRHSLLIAEKYPSSLVLGVDYSESNISSARSKKDGLMNVEFEVADLREYRSDRTFDIVLCLYDVIGSFPDDSDNEAIMKTLASCCETGGYLALFVMNMELTRYLAHLSNICDVEADPKVLFDLPPGDVMHKSGDIFNPDLYLIDTKTGLVYRKEQFGEDSSLPAEYIIRDRRYTAEEIAGLVARYGFDVIDYRYVRAGRWSEPLESTDSKAKEILVIARKI